jgi:hypothetical protein
MLTQTIIESKNFKLYDSLEDYRVSLGIFNIFRYLALADVEVENADNIEFPIELTYSSDGHFILTTYYNNPKMYDEMFQSGELLTETQLDEMITRLNWKVKKIDLTKIKNYE